MGIRLQPSWAIAIAAGVPAVASTIAVVFVACIPDLPAAPASDGGANLVPPPPCGDGIVDLALGEQCDPGPFGDAEAVQGCSRSCRMVCDGGFVWDRNNHCYYVAAPSAGSFMGVSSVCGASSGHVVTFASEQELGAVTKALDAGTFWVGISQEISSKYVSIVPLEPGWEPGCTGCYVHARNPDAPLPAPDAAVSVACVEGFRDLDASWQEISCTIAPRRGPGAICEREPSGRLSANCEAGDDCFDLPFTYPRKSYVLIRSDTDPTSAQNACAGLGGTLVVLESRDEREQLWKELAKITELDIHASSYGVLIGLGSEDGGPWTWADDSGPDAYPPPWAFRQPRDGGTQAFLYENSTTTSPSVDNTLARSAEALAYPYVCQLLATDE